MLFKHFLVPQDQEKPKKAELLGIVVDIVVFFNFLINLVNNSVQLLQLFINPDDSLAERAPEKKIQVYETFKVPIVIGYTEHFTHKAAVLIHEFG